MNKKLSAVSVSTLLLFVCIVTTVQVGLAITWSADTRLTQDPSDDWDPSIIQAVDGKIWVAWHSGRTGNYDIFYKTSSDNGASWTGDIQLTSDTGQDFHPSILQTRDGKIWVVWDSDRTGTFELYYKKSLNNGASWSSDTRLTFDPTRNSFPSIMQTSDGKVWVFWTSGRNVTVSPPDPTYTLSANIFYKTSSDSGQTWSADTLVVTDYKNNYRDDLYPSAMEAQNGTVWMVWAKEAKDIYYKLYNGTGWSWETRLTFDAKENTHPFIMQTVNGRIWVFYDSFRNAHDGNVYYRVFYGSWSNDIQLTTAMEDDQWPSAMQAKDSTIWVVWNSPRYEQLVYDIFYRTGMELHDVAVKRITPYTYHENNTLAYRGELVYTEVEVENQGEGKETFEVKGYANSTQIGSRTVTLDPGRTYVLVFTWNTSKVKPGTYIPNAVAVITQGETDTLDNYLSGDSFEVRIKGDICGWYGGVLKPIPDRRVNLDDFMVTAANWGTSSPTWNPVWGPACDVTEDDKVDIDDVMTVGGHYGET